MFLQALGAQHHVVTLGTCHFTSIDIKYCLSFNVMPSEFLVTYQ
jgi:hypothetical protein